MSLEFLLPHLPLLLVLAFFLGIAVTMSMVFGFAIKAVMIVLCILAGAVNMGWNLMN